LVVKIGFQNLFPIAAALLLIAILCITRLRRWVESSHVDDVIETAASVKPLGGNPFSGITHVFSSKYFTAIAISSVIASLLGTALYMFMAEMVESAIIDVDERTRFFSNINNVQNALAILGQLFLVKHVVSRFGIGVSMALLPVVSVASFILLALEPTLAIVAFLTVLRRALGFAFSKPTTDMLYSAVTPEDKYKTKNFIDTAVYRFGDVVGARAVNGFAVLGLTIPAISLLMLPFAAIWAVVSLWLGKDYPRRAKQLRDSGVT
jgi:AAA family ATP:ADP antiporter